MPVLLPGQPISSRRSVFQPAAAGGWTPADLGSTLKLWVQPSGLTGVDNDPITTWANDGAEGDATQATGAQKPTLKTNILNGHSVARFDGVDDNLATASFSLTDITAAAVVKLSATASFPMVLTRGAGEGELRYNGSTSTPMFQGIAGLGSAVWGSNVGTTAFHILVGTLTDSGNQVTVNVDGGTAVTASDGGSGWVANAVTTIGQRTGGGFHFVGDIAEAIQCDTVLSSGDLASLVSYWQTKFAL